MSQRSLFAVVAAALAVTAGPLAARPAPGACAFGVAPTVLLDDGDPHAKNGKRLEMWEVADAPIWWSAVHPDGAYGDFRAKVAARVPETRPIPLLRQVPQANNQVILDHARQWIHPANCLEMLLIARQYARIDLLEQPTEFAAVVLRSPDGRRLRIYNYTINQDGIGRATPISEPAARDHRGGWAILGFLHNHNFHPGDPLTNGPLAPSVPDANFNLNFAREAGLAEAWITNGLNTVRIPAAAFPAFEHEGG